MTELTYEQHLQAFAAAKEYVRDLETSRTRAFRFGGSWAQEMEDELVKARKVRAEHAAAATQIRIDERGTEADEIRRAPTEGTDA